MKAGRKNLQRACQDGSAVTLAVGESIMQVVTLRGSNLIESNNHLRKEFCDNSVSASVLIPHLQNLVQQTTFQQDLITNLMSNLQQNEKADGLQSRVQTLEGDTRVETGSGEGERALLAKIFDLQSRMISLTDELISSKLKHVQLQEELNTLYSQEEIIDTREQENEEA